MGNNKSRSKVTEVFNISSKLRECDAVSIGDYRGRVSTFIKNHPILLWNTIHKKDSKISLVRTAYSQLKNTVREIAPEKVIVVEKLHELHKSKRKLIKEIIKESLEEKKKGLDGKACWDGYKLQGTKMKGGKRVDNCVKMEEDLTEKKGKCKPSKGKRFAKRVNGKCRSYGQKGKAKKGGDRIRPGTKKGHAYCARSAKIKKCKNPPCANALSRKKWKCQGSRSVA